MDARSPSTATKPVGDCNSLAPRQQIASSISSVLHAPIVPIMLRLGLPTLVVLVVQALVGVVEIYFISFLGIDALAGAALVFPVLMLMQMMANGGIGGGVASAVARSLGGGRSDDAQALAFHALVLGTVFGLAFTIAAVTAGPLLYRALGGESGALAAAIAYSNAVFLAAIPLWITALMAAVLRGAGEVKVPALVTFAGALVLIPLSPALIFGWGPFPGLGIAGAGAAVTTYYLAAALTLIGYLASGRAGIRLVIGRIRWQPFVAIMRVGGLSAIGTLQANLTVALITGAVGIYGAPVIAGYGIASRLDYLLIPLLFGFGTASVTMVGINVGAGQPARARRIAWTGAAIGGGATGLIGFAAALFPRAWSATFTDDAAALATSALYLRTVAPFYVLFGAGYMLYFASQGAGRVLWPVIGGTARLLIAGIGWIAAVGFGIALADLFIIVAASSVVFGIICVAAVRAPSWGEAQARAPVSKMGG